MNQDGKLYIKIERLPQGAAPEWVRQKWVGLVIPLIDGHGSEPFECRILNMGFDLQSIVYRIKLLFGFYETMIGYVSTTSIAVQLLEKKDKNAAQWFKENFPNKNCPILVFDHECCRLVHYNKAVP